MGLHHNDGALQRYRARTLRLLYKSSSRPKNSEPNWFRWPKSRLSINKPSSKRRPEWPSTLTDLICLQSSESLRCQCRSHLTWVYWQCRPTESDFTCPAHGKDLKALNQLYLPLHLPCLSDMIDIQMLLIYRPWQDDFRWLWIHLPTEPNWTQSPCCALLIVSIFLTLRIITMMIDQFYFIITNAILMYE